MKSKPFRFLVNFLLFVLFIYIAVIPTVLTVADGDYDGLAIPMAAIGLWLLLFGRMKIGRLRLEGRQAFAVGGALIIPTLLLVVITQMDLWPPLRIGSVVAGLVTAVILSLAVKPTAVSKDRTLALIILGGGLVLVLIGSSMPVPADAAGMLIINGLPLLPIASMSLFLQLIGIGATLGGLFGLIVGFKPQPR